MAGEEEEFPLSGNDIIEDPREHVREARLHSGTCSMEGCRLNIGIKKAPGIKKELYNVMKNIQHNSLIPLLNFYHEGNQGRFVIPPTGICFDRWLRKDGSKLLIDENGNMTNLFKNMIIDVCDVVEKLYASKILIKNLCQNNLHIAKETNPRILVLITQAEILKNPVSKFVIWNPVRDIVEWCYKECNCKLIGNSRRYVDFICQDKFSVEALRKYPENWDPFTKGEYLVALMAADQRDIRAGIKGARIAWPRVNKEVPEVLSKLIDEEMRQGRSCSSAVPFDYVNLIRNKHKHFEDLPEFAKEVFGHSREGFVKQLETWTPTLWQDLFDIIGWP